MSKFLKILISSLLILLFNCKNSKETPSTKRKTVEKKTQKADIKKPIPKAWDSLNSKNTEAFLTAYGKKNKETKVLIKTDFGEIKILLYEDVPVHRANFIFLTKIAYFNSTVFYRVAKNFVIQGGNSDRMYTQKQRNKYGNYLMQPEFKSNRKHKYGALAAARQWKNNPNKLSSPFEFYIVHKKNGAHHLNGEHTVFGEVISGYDTMDKISEVNVDIDEWPMDDVHMTVEIIE